MNMVATQEPGKVAVPEQMTKSCFFCGSTDLSQGELRGRPGRCRYCGSLMADAATITPAVLPAAPPIAVGLYMGSDAVNADNLRKAMTIVERVTGKAPTVITDHNTGARVYVVNGYDRRFNTVEFVKLARQINGEGARAAEVAVAMASKPNGANPTLAEIFSKESPAVGVAPETNIKQLPLAQIRRDGGTQPRAALDNETLAEYAEAMAGGATFPAVVVFYDGHDYWLADGFHRVNAAINAGRDHINVNVIAGTQRDAILYSTGANAQHGLRRTNADKRRAVERLLRDEEWAKWSDNEIARRCVVDHKTVAAARLSLGNSQVTNDERTYVTKSGTVATMKTAAIGQPAQSEQIGRTPAQSLVRISPPAVATDTLAAMADLADNITPERLAQLKNGIRQWLKFSYSHASSGAQAITLLQGILDRKTRSQQSDWEQLTMSRFMPQATPGERLLAVQAVLQELQASTPAPGKPAAAKDLDDGYQPRSVRDPALMARRAAARAEAGLPPDSEALADYGQVLAGVKAWLHRYCAVNNQYAVMVGLVANSIEAHEHWRNLYVSPYLPLVYSRNDLQLANKAIATSLAPAQPAVHDDGLAQFVAATPTGDDLRSAMAMLAANLTDDQRQEVGENLARMAADEAEWARNIETGKIKQPERLIVHRTTMAMLYLVRDAIR